MLTEQNHMDLVDDLNNNVSYDIYGMTGVALPVQVKMGWEQFDATVPDVRVEFFPVPSNRYQFVSDLVGFTENGFPRYEVCEEEHVVVTILAPRYASGVHGRLIGQQYLDNVEQRVLTGWPSLLHDMRASLDRGVPLRKINALRFRDSSNAYGYELSFNIKTTRSWTLDTGDPDDLGPIASGVELDLSVDGTSDSTTIYTSSV